VDKRLISSRRNLFGEYTSGEFKFTGYLFFDKSGGKLSLVKLKLRDMSQSSKLVGALRTKYGEPSTQGRTQLAEFWVWRTNTDQISVVKIGAGAVTADVSLDYQPRIRSSASVM